MQNDDLGKQQKMISSQQVWESKHQVMERKNGKNKWSVKSMRETLYDLSCPFFSLKVKEKDEWILREAYLKSTWIQP